MAQACLSVSARVLQDEQSRSGAIRGVRQPAVIDVDVVDLNRDRLSFFHRIRVLVRFGDVVSEFFQAVRVAEVHNTDTGIEIRQPRDLVLESIDLSVYGFSRLMRTESPTLVAEVADGHLPNGYGEWLRLGCDIKHVRTGSNPLGARFHVASARLVHNEGVRA